jgi:hypothetical protein
LTAEVIGYRDISTVKLDLPFGGASLPEFCNFVLTSSSFSSVVKNSPAIGFPPVLSAHGWMEDLLFWEHDIFCSLSLVVFNLTVHLPKLINLYLKIGEFCYK